MAADDAVSLLRSLKAAGEKTGAVEAEGALHLRRNSRRTMDGNHDAAPTAIQCAGTSISLPTPKYTSSAAAAASPGPVLIPGALSLGSTSVPLPTAAGSPGTSAAVAVQNQAGLSLAAASSVSGSLPAIISTTSSPAASPSRLSVRPPMPLTSLPSPTAGSPGAGAGGGGSAAAAATAQAHGHGGGPSSPPHGSPGPNRRTIHGYMLSCTAYDAVQLPHSHGSPLPLLFDPPVSVPLPSTAFPTGSPISAVGMSAPSSPRARQVQFAAALATTTAAAAPSSPSGTSSLPSIASGGNVGTGGGGLPPTPISFFLLCSSSARVPSGRSSLGGAASNLMAAAGGGDGSPHKQSLPTGNSPTGAVAAASSPSGSCRHRPPPSPSPFATPQSAAVAAAAPPSPGSPPSASAPVLSQLQVPVPAGQSPRGSVNPMESGGVAPSPLPLMSSTAAAALQLQLQQAAAAATASVSAASSSSSSPLPPALYHHHRQHHQHYASRPSSARSLVGYCCGVAAPGEGALSGTLSSRRLSMTGGVESSQKLVLAAAHELSSLTQSQAHNHHHHHQQHQHQQQPAQQLLQQFQQPAQQQRPPLRGPSFTGPGALTSSGGFGGGPNRGGGSASALPFVPATRDGRSSDPGTSGGMVAAAAAGAVLEMPAAATATAAEFGFPAAEPPLPLPAPQPAGRASYLAPLPPGVIQQAVRTSTPPAAAAVGEPAVVRPLSSQAPFSLQPKLRAIRTEPLPTPSTLPPAAVALPEPLQPRQEPLPPLTSAASLPVAAAAQLPAAVAANAPRGRAGALAPLGSSEDVVATAAGPVAESSLDPSMPDLDPAALFRQESGSLTKAGFMELTVRAMAVQPASPSAVQSSVRQRLQTDPLRFHPPAGARRHGSLDPLEATPRLVLGDGGGSVPRPRPPSASGSGSPKTAGSAAGGDALWAPSRDILPHISSSGSSGGSGSSRLAFHPGLSSPSAAAPAVSLSPATPSMEAPTPRLHTFSGAGGATTGEGAASPHQTLHFQLQQHQQHLPRPAGGLQSTYLQSLAAAAGLGGGGGDGGRLQRQRSLSDSGCGGGSFLAAAAAAADGGPVGLPLEGDLAVLGNMWSRLRTERHHNTRYGAAEKDVAAAAAGGPGAAITAMGLAPTSPGGNVRSISSTTIAADRFCSGCGGGAPRVHGSGVSSGGGGHDGGGLATHGSVPHVRLDASVSSLPLKALKTAPGAGAAAAAGAAAVAATTASDGAGAVRSAGGGAGREED